MAKRQRSATRTEAEFQEAYEKYFDTVYRMAFLHVKKPEEAADIAQDVFFKYYCDHKIFEGPEHLKAWLLTCSHNACMDYFRSKIRKNVSLDRIQEMGLPFEIDETLGVLLSLPDKYKTPIYMHYYEGYSTDEIGKLLHKPGATVRVNLHRGREMLKKKLKGEAL